MFSEGKLPSLFQTGMRSIESRFYMSKDEAEAQALLTERALIIRHPSFRWIYGDADPLIPPKV